MKAIPAEIIEQRGISAVDEHVSLTNACRFMLTVPVVDEATVVMDSGTHNGMQG